MKQQIKLIEEGVLKVNNIYILTEEAYTRLSIYKNAFADIEGSIMNFHDKMLEMLNSIGNDCQ